MCLQVLELVPIDCTMHEDIVKLKEQIVRHILTKDTFPCAERTLPKSYKDVELAIYDLVEQNQIPQHGKFFSSKKKKSLLKVNSF